MTHAERSSYADVPVPRTDAMVTIDEMLRQAAKARLNLGFAGLLDRTETGEIERSNPSTATTSRKYATCPSTP
jgi:hypothetical protein